MKKVNIVNETCCKCLGVDLLKLIYSIAYRQKATDVIISKCTYNRWAEVTLLKSGTTIERNFYVGLM